MSRRQFCVLGLFLALFALFTPPPIYGHKCPGIAPRPHIWHSGACGTRTAGYGLPTTSRCG